MIVLDEQLLGYGLQDAIATWYRGVVTDITQLRPRSRVLDDAIPSLLRTVRYPTFVTINVADFWRRIAPDKRSAILCFDLPDPRARDISLLLRRLLRHKEFRTRRARMGKIARIAATHAHYYTNDSWAIRTIDWPRSRR
jgi:hypothetical protein